MGILKDKLMAVLGLHKPSHKQPTLPLDEIKASITKGTLTPGPVQSNQSTHKKPSIEKIKLPLSSAKPRVKLPEHSPDVVIQSDAKVGVNAKFSKNQKLLQASDEPGRYESIHLMPNSEKREISLGLDFGTSSVKVVIGDHGTDQSYAVPFLDAIGIDAFLLPSRVFALSKTNPPDSKSQFTLEQSDLAYRDLKLGLLGNSQDRDRQVQVIAFLAQVIHRSRSWLFSEHKSIYKDIHCLWRLRVGLPAAPALDNELVPIFAKIAHAAWALAGQTGSPTLDQTAKSRDAVFLENLVSDDLEVEIIPEIAAQIYGFVVSTSFDSKKPNRYLMVDVGAGTVDASLFRVVPVKGGRWDFEFYTAVIEPYGVSNLHASRVDWWINNLPDGQGGATLKENLLASKFNTDLGNQYPNSCAEYVAGVKFTKTYPNKCDDEFFDKKLSKQVQGTAVWRAFKNGFLDKAQLKDIPMFICGGGSRGKYYAGLEKLVQHPPGFSWLSVQPWQLGFPKDLIAEGVSPDDFDRLSVAYGLSKLEVGKVTKAMPIPKVSLPPSATFEDRFIDKDQC